MPEPEEEKQPVHGIGSGALGTGDLRAWAHERVGGHEWRVEIREHKLAEWKRSQGLTTIAILIRLDGELLASVYPLQMGFGVDIVSDHLDLDDPTQVTGSLPPAVAFYKKGHSPFANMPQGR